MGPKDVAELVTVWAGQALADDPSTTLILQLNDAFSLLLEPGDFGAEITRVSLQSRSWHTVSMIWSDPLYSALAMGVLR